jgi:hypothetical protein
MTRNQLLEVDNATFWKALEELHRQAQENRTDGFNLRAEKLLQAIDDMAYMGGAFESYADKVYFLLNHYDLWVNGTFVFPDGDVWEKNGS